MIALALGLELSILVGLSAYIGHKIDQHYGITIFVIVMPIVAFTGGMFRLYYKLKNIYTKND